MFSSKEIRTALLFTSLCVVSLAIHPLNASAAAQPVFEDNFDGTSLNTAAWQPIGPSRFNFNSEEQCYVPEANSVSGGNLVITSNLADSTCRNGNLHYTAGMIQWRSYNFTYGTVEFRAKMPGGQGPWPAIWLLGADCQATNPTDSSGACHWPTAGSNEMDMLENLLGDSTKAYQTVFFSTSGYVNCTPIISDMSQNWHDFTFTWTPSSLTWTIDGVPTCTQTQPELIPSKPVFLIMNTAIGGNAGGFVDNSIFPRTMLVDHVKVTPSGAGNPAPRLFSVSPSSAVVGASSFTLTVNGANFVDSSVVRFNGQVRVTTYISDSQLSIPVTADDLNAASNNSVLVVNGGPGGGISAPQMLRVAEPTANPTTRFFSDTVHNYPNPFRLGGGSTKFVVLTDEAGTVDLQVYDAGGQFVTSMSRSISGAGRTEVFWDGHNSRGEMVSPGLYMVRIHGQGAHDETQFRRVVAVK